MSTFCQLCRRVRKKMEKVLRRLEDTLRGLSELHERLKAVMERQRKAIVEMRSEDLAAINGEEATLLEQIGDLEHRRNELCARAAQELGIPMSERHTVTRIARELPAEERRSLESVRDDLVECAGKLKFCAELNFGLARVGLDHAERCLGIIFGMGRKKPTYDPQEMRKGPGAALFEATA